MIQLILAKLGSIKLSLSQYLLVAAAGTIAVLASVLKFKEGELTATRVDLLKSHYENETQRTNDVLAVAALKVKASKEKYEASLNHLNRLRGS